MNFEYDIQGFDSMVIGLQAQSAHLRLKIKEAVADTIDAAEKAMLAEVPRDSGHLANSIRSTGVIYSPGGPGGGGVYEAELSVGEGIPYLDFVVEGTGIWGPRASPIHPANGNFMKWIGKEGETVYAAETQGQFPQDEWVREAQRVAEQVMSHHVSEIDLER